MDGATRLDVPWVVEKAMTRTEAADTVRIMERLGLHASAQVLRKRYGLDKVGDSHNGAKTAQQADGAPKAPANK